MVKNTNLDIWESILNTEQPKRRKKKVGDLPPALRGPSQNKYGGHQSQKMKPLRGSTFGPANDGRSLSADEIAKTRRAPSGIGII